jgi:two-component system cell cycle sensor histidine kinase/response regulator CckA
MSSVLEAVASTNRSIKRSGGILLVEDDHQVRFFALTYLRHLGYTVLEARSADEAIELWSLRPTSIDLLFTDVALGQTDGVRLAGMLLGLTGGLKILFTSGSANEMVAAMCAKNPSFRFLPKPYFPKELAQIVGEMLEPKFG